MLEPEKLAQLYICDEHIDATEYDYMKAIELAGYVANEEQRSDLTIRIWCSAILRNTWSNKQPLSPLEFLQKTLFYKLADLAITIGKFFLSYLNVL